MQKEDIEQMLSDCPDGGSEELGAFGIFDFESFMLSPPGLIVFQSVTLLQDFGPWKQGYRSGKHIFWIDLVQNEVCEVDLDDEEKPVASVKFRLEEVKFRLEELA